MPLVSVRGGPNDAAAGPMAATPSLHRSPYIRQILASFHTVIGRSRLMRVDGGECVEPHVDIHYYWHDRVRVHIPIVTDPAVRFSCDGSEVHMAAGEVWLLDTWRVHSVINASPTARIHLVFDTVGSAHFWDLVAQAERPSAADPHHPYEPRLLAFDPQAGRHLVTEQHNLPVVMSPSELSMLVEDALSDAGADGVVDDALMGTFRRCTQEWRSVWAVHGQDSEGWPTYRELQERLLATAAAVSSDVRLRSNGQPLPRVLRARINAALNPMLAS